MACVVYMNLEGVVLEMGHCSKARSRGVKSESAFDGVEIKRWR
jgi:hypothetical protein